MGMTRAQKEQEVEVLKQGFEENEIVVVTHYQGLTVAEVTELRSKMREQGASFKVTKNSLARIALKGTRFEHLDEMFKGQTGIAVSKDPVAAAKVANDFAKSHEKLVILGGGLGEKALDVASVKHLASLPSLDELRSKLVGLLQAPAGQLARIAQAPAGQLARVVGAQGAKSE